MKFKSLLASLLFVVACSVGESSFASEKVRFLIPQRSVDESLALFIVPKYLGYYEQEGLDVDLIFVGGSNEAAIQVAAGNAEIGEASPAQAVIGMEEGSAAAMDIRYFYDAGYKNIWSISVPEDSPIKSIKDLRGKKIGVTALGSAGTTYGKAYIRAAGLNPDSDVSFIAIGGGTQAAAAIKQKVVDAVVFWDTGVIQFETNGIPLRALEVDKRLAELPDVSLLAKNELIKSNPKLLIAFARAVAKGIDFSLANPAAAVLITWKLYPESKSKDTTPEKAMERGLKMSVRLPTTIDPATDGKHGLFIETNWTHVSDFLLEGGQIRKPIPASRMFTNSLVDDINQYDRGAIIKQAHNFDLKTVQ
jgi:NitT/TauT family transport system substrate-binding protein